MFHVAHDHLNRKRGLLRLCHPHLVYVKVTPAAPAGPAPCTDPINGPDPEVTDAATFDVSGVAASTSLLRTDCSW